MTAKTTQDGNGCDLVGCGQWDDIWQGCEIPLPIDPTQGDLDHHRDTQMHRYFTERLRGVPRGELLEVGCAKSQWLPYFALTQGFRVAGMDYSEIGCAQAQEILRRAGVNGEVLCHNVFDLLPPLAERFDVVVSFGLVEHFTDTKGIIKALAHPLKPGGMLITVIPNTRNLSGLLLRIADRELYDQHIPLGPTDLAQAGISAGLEPLENKYFMTLSPSVMSLGFARNMNKWLAKPAWTACDIVTKAASAIIRAGVPEMPNPWTSPYVVSAMRKPPRK